MTEVMAAPIAAAIGRQGVVRTHAKVTRLLTDGRRVHGVESAGEQIAANHVVLATSWRRRRSSSARRSAPIPGSSPCCTCRPCRRSRSTGARPPVDAARSHHVWPGDRARELCRRVRTAFRQSPGRLSVILTPPEPFLEMDPAAILEITCRDAARLGLRVREHLIAYRVVKLPADFYSLAPAMRCCGRHKPRLLPV